MNHSAPPAPHRLASSDRTVRIGQVWYDEATRACLDPAFEPIANVRLGRFFEADVVRAKIEARWHSGAELVGIFSWRFGRKIPIGGTRVLELLDRAPAADVYSFFGALQDGPIWRLAEHKHPGILAAARELFVRLGVRTDPADLVAPPIYQHHFVASATVYERFVDEMLGPALNAMAAGDPELDAALGVDSTYRDERHGLATLERLYGTTWLPLHPFVAERLFSSWLALHRTVSVYPLWGGRFVEEGDVIHEPELSGRRT